MSTTRMPLRPEWSWREKPDGWWCLIEAAEVREMAKAMRQDGVRFAALTLCPDGEALRCAWHWDSSGVLHTAEARLGAEDPAPSIVDLWPGADWAEREARDYYAVVFTGRESTPPLMLRPGDAPGVLLRPGEDARP